MQQKSEKTGEDLTGQELEQKKGMGLEQSQSNVSEKENNSKSGKIVDIKKRYGTPFEIVVIEDGEKGFIAIGNQRITEPMPVEELDLMINGKDWELITKLVVNITEKVVLAIKEEDIARNETINDKYQTKMSFEEEATEREK